MFLEWIRQRESEERAVITRERNDEITLAYTLAEMHTWAGLKGAYPELQSDLEAEAFLAYNGLLSIGTTTYEKAVDLLRDGYPELSMNLLRLALENWIAA